VASTVVVAAAVAVVVVVVVARLSRIRGRSGRIEPQMKP
jgi:hypothetical protein